MNLRRALRKGCCLLFIRLGEWVRWVERVGKWAVAVAGAKVRGLSGDDALAAHPVEAWLGVIAKALVIPALIAVGVGALIPSTAVMVVAGLALLALCALWWLMAYRAARAEGVAVWRVWRAMWLVPTWTFFGLWEFLR